MRILYLCAGTHSGIVTFQTEALREWGAEVECFDVGEHFGYRMKRVKLPSLRPGNVWNSLVALRRWGRDWRGHFGRTDFAFRLLSARARRFWAANEHRFDVVIQSGAMWHGAPECRKIPYVIHTDHTYAISKSYPPQDGLPMSADASARWEEMERACYHDADLIFPMSDFVKRSLANDYGVTESRIAVTGGGPNLAVPDQCPPQDPDGKTLLFVGKDFPRKGGPQLLEAFAQVRAEIPEAKLIVAGPAHPVLAPGVEWHGALRHDEMPALYQRSRIFVLPSLREPYGISFLEAMAHGLPCVGTRVEAIPEIIDNGRTGLLAEPGDPTALAEAVLALLKDPGLSASMGAAGYAKVREELNWRTVTGRMLEQLRRTVAKFRSSDTGAEPINSTRSPGKR